MSFKLSTELVFPWPVTVLEPSHDEPGKLEEKTFTGVFALVSPEKAKARDDARKEIGRQISALQGRIATARAEGDEATALDGVFEEITALEEKLSDHDTLAARDVFRGWKDDLLDENGQPMPVNAESIDWVFSHTRVRSGLVRAYREAISEDKARLKN